MLLSGQAFVTSIHILLDLSVGGDLTNTQNYFNVNIKFC